MTILFCLFVSRSVSEPVELDAPVLRCVPEDITKRGRSHYAVEVVETVSASRRVIFFFSFFFDLFVLSSVRIPSDLSVGGCG